MERILVVEDDTSIALGLEDDLSLEGYEVEVARDGEAATSRAREGVFDLILLDVMLPKKDGFEVCRRIKSREKTREISVIAITAHHSKKAESRILEAGALAYFTKPLDIEALVAEVESALA